MFGTAAMKVNMENDANTHVISLPEGSEVIGVISVKTPRLIASSLPPEEEIYLLFHIPLASPLVPKGESIPIIRIIINSIIVGRSTAPPIFEKYLGTVAFKGQLINFYKAGEVINDKGSIGASLSENQIAGGH